MMNRKQRFKLGAGAGLVTMLLGALMVLAPVGAGAATVAPVLNPGGNDNPSCASLGYDVEVKHNVQTNAGAGSGQLSTTVTVDDVTYEFVVDWTFLADKTISFDVVTDDDANVDLLVSAAIVKQAAASSNGGANVYAYDPPVSSDTGLVDPRGDGQFSHLTFCANVPSMPAPTGSLSVDKDLAGNNQPDANTTFGFTVACMDDDEAVALDASDAAFTLTAAQQKTITELPVGASCTVTETDAAGATSTTYKIGEGATTPGTVAVASIAANATTAVLFTNTYTSTPDIPTPTFTYSIDLEKLNNANRIGGFSDEETAAVEGDAVEFQITIRNTGTGALVLEELTDEFGGAEVDLLDPAVDLRCPGIGNALAVGSVLAAGSTTVCTFELDDYAPPAGEDIVNTVTVETNRADDSDTSTVDTREVEVLPTPPVTPPAPPEETPPAVTPPVKTPVVQPATEVKGVQTVRTLPRTGDETRGLAGVGAFMLALGAAMVIGSKRQLVRR